MKNTIIEARKFLTAEQKAQVANGKKINLSLEQVINITGYERSILEQPISRNLMTSPDLIGSVERLEDLTGRELNLYDRIYDLNEQESYLTVFRFFADKECPTKIELALFGKK